MDYPKPLDQGQSGDRSTRRRSHYLYLREEHISALKGKTTRTKSVPVSRDYVKVPLEMLKLHYEVFLTADIFFVNKIPFFLTLSRKICFTAVNHLANRTIPHIFKAFKEIYSYYLQRGFQITVLHVDSEFAPLKILIESRPGGPVVKTWRVLTSTSQRSSKEFVLWRKGAEKSAQPAIPADSKASDDTHCVQ